MKIQPDWEEKALKNKWSNHAYDNSWCHFVMYEETELDTLISLCKFYQQEEFAKRIQKLKDIIYNGSIEKVEFWWLSDFNPLVLKERLLKQFCYRKQMAKKQEITTHLDEVLSFTDKTSAYAKMMNSYYYQQQCKEKVQDALEQQSFYDDKVKSIEEAILKFGSLEEIDAEWQEERYKELRNERKCATSAK